MSTDRDQRHLGESRDKQKSKDKRSNNKKEDDDDGSTVYNYNCNESDDPFTVENKNVVLRCFEVSSKQYACGWPEVRRKCPCSCKGYTGYDGGDYDYVYNHEEDDIYVHNYGGGGFETPSTCSNVNHPFSIYKDYEKVLVYCSDLAKQEYSYACSRDRPRKKCPITCKVCNGNQYDDYTKHDDYVKYDDYIKQDDLYNHNGNSNSNEVSTSCTDVSTQFQITKNGEQVSIRCFNLLQKDFSYACKFKRTMTKCPVTCGVCSQNSNNNNNKDDDYTHAYKDDDYTHDYKDDDYTHGYKDDDFKYHGYNNNNAHDIFSDDDFSIIYIDDY